MDLAKERAQSAVQAEKLAPIIYGGHMRLEYLLRLWSAVENDPEFAKENRAFQNHSQRYVAACRKIKRFQEIVQENKLDCLDKIYDAYLAIDENIPLDVHLSMFIPTMTLHTSEEQRKRWLDASKSFRIIGAYAQTELAHGSNIRGIETTATYDRGSQEFVIHSPTLTSMKWWPGGLAHTATHAIVYANLIIDDRSYGPHPFMVLLRSLVDHRPLPGIELGDIGPKLGYNSMDNGYARFTNVRIPREDMLMGFAQVSPNGRYSKKEGAEKVLYGIMLDVRTRICVHSAYVLARALTIAIRYSCVREQGFVGSHNPEPLVERVVMDYPTQQRVLMPLLAMSYALHFTGACVRSLYLSYTTTRDMALLADLHATSAGLKAFITTVVSEGVEACRKMCGGHGFLVSAGFAELYTSYLPMCTLEGTREVLLQQTGRYLLKMRAVAIAGKRSMLSSSTFYLLGRVSNTPRTPKALSINPLKEFLRCSLKRETMTTIRFRDVALLLVELLRRRAALCIDNAAQTFAEYQYQFSYKQASQISYQNAPEPILAASVEICQAAEAHCELFILEKFYGEIARLTSTSENSSGEFLSDLSPEAKAMREMFVLLSVTFIGRNLGQFLMTGALAVNDVKLLQTAAFLLCSSLRHDAVNLIEAWKFSDQRLASTLGNSAGNVYEALYEATKKEPLNASEVSEGYEKYLKFVIKKPYENVEGDSTSNASEQMNDNSSLSPAIKSRL